MTKSGYVFESGEAIDVGSPGDHDYVFSSGEPVTDSGVSTYVFESGTGLRGGGGGGGTTWPYIYVFGGRAGETHTEVYDVDNDTWETRANLNTSRTQGEGGQLNGYPIAPSMSQDTATVEQYDPATDSWAYIDSMPEYRHFPAVDFVGDTLYVTAGADPSGFSDLHYGYSGSWDTSLSNFPQTVHAPRAESDGTLLWLTGGELNGNFRDRTYSYDPDTDTWTEHSRFQDGREVHGMALYDGFIYIMGGTTDGGDFPGMERYNIATDTWTQSVADPPSLGFNNWGNAEVGTDGRIYFICNEMAAYDPDTDTWDSSVSNPPVGCDRGAVVGSTRF